MKKNILNLENGALKKDKKIVTCRASIEKWIQVSGSQEIPK